MLYLTTSWAKIPYEYEHYFGVIFSYRATIPDGTRALNDNKLWLLDNGAYTNNFSENGWVRNIEKFLKYSNNCIGLPLPDVVGDYKQTLDNYWKYYDVPIKYGLPRTFVTQDGISSKDVPFKYIDTLFVGGTNEHKFSESLLEILLTAKEHNIWIHVGRVNSIKRIKYFYMANSVDGSEFSIIPKYRAQRSVENFVYGLQWSRNKYFEGI